MDPMKPASPAVTPRIDWNGSSRFAFAAPQRTPARWLPEFLGAKPSTATNPDLAALTIRIDA
jgi:hypothetical protein